MSNTVQQDRCQLCIAKDQGPFAEAKVGGDGDARAFVRLAEQMEQQGAA